MSSFGMYAIVRLTFSVGGRPFTSRSPLILPSTVRPARTLRSDVAPESGAPMTATHMPGLMYPDMPLSTGTPLREKKRLRQTCARKHTESK